MVDVAGRYSGWCCLSLSSTPFASSSFRLSDTDRCFRIQRLECFLPTFNGATPAPQLDFQTRARLWRFPACRSRLPGLMLRFMVCYLVCLLTCACLLSTPHIHQSYGMCRVGLFGFTRCLFASPFRDMPYFQRSFKNYRHAALTVGTS